MTENDWETSYKLMKDNYEELYKLRHTSVSEDSEELERKIEEHKKIHEISTNELKMQNEQLKEELKRGEEKRKKVEQLKKNISNLQSRLTMKEPIFQTAFKYQEKIRFVNGKKGRYMFEAGNDGQVLFELIRGENNEITYHPIHIGVNTDGKSDWIPKTCKVQSKALDELFSTIANLDFE